jgi:opacity protein-like surface antigen
MKTLQKREQKYAKSIYRGLGGTVFLCLCLLSLPAHAIWLGQSQINPYLEIQENYESNLYNTSEDEESGWITVISPGVHAEFPNTEDAVFKIIGNYRANVKFYDKHGDSELDPNEELNTVEHRLEGKAEANFPSGIGFAAGYILNLSSYPPSDPTDIRDKYIQHNVTAMAKYAFINRYEVQLDYQGMLRRFDDLEDDDMTNHGIDATFFYRLFPTLSLLGGGGYSIIDRQEPAFSDSTEIRGFGGVRLEATATLTGLAKVGMGSKNFDNDNFEDVSTVYAVGELAAQFTENTRLSVAINRTVTDTSLAEINSGNGEYSIVTGLKGNLQHTPAVLPNLSLKGMAGFQREEYPEDIDEREDSIFEVSAGADYKFFKYLIVGAKYVYTRRDSSIDAKDYGSNRATLSLQGIL